MKFEPFTYKTLSLLENRIKELDLNIPISPELEILKTSVNLNDRFIPNRLAVQPMEGYDAESDGSPSDLTLRRYKRYANGGTGLIWFEATAISEDGKSNPNQLYLTEDNSKNFKALIEQVRDDCNKTLKDLGFKNKVLLILQLNHSGRYSGNTTCHTALFQKPHWSDRPVPLAHTPPGPGYRDTADHQKVACAPP